MSYKWFGKLNIFFAQDWRIMAFQPLLYLFIFGASIRLALSDSEPPRFDVITDGFYQIWLGLGIIGPLLATAAWFCVKHLSGIWKFRGMWFRLGADLMMFTNLFTYHIASLVLHEDNQTRIFSRYVFGASMLFVLVLIMRDVWSLVLTERLASRIRLEHE